MDAFILHQKYREKDRSPGEANLYQYFSLLNTEIWYDKMQHPSFPSFQLTEKQKLSLEGKKCILIF